MGDIERNIRLPAHLWDALEAMSRDMGASVPGLVGQSIFTLARLNGYFLPGKPGTVSSGRDNTRKPTGSDSGRGIVAAPTGRASSPPPFKGSKPSSSVAELPEDPSGLSPEKSEYAPDAYGADEGLPDDVASDQFLSEPPVPESGSHAKGAALPMVHVSLSVPGREKYEMDQESILIGRGKHCDFIIDSNRVSREHARLTRDRNDVLLEDLGSSNGTFHAATKEKITRRKIKDGDEIVFGTERVKFSVKNS